VKNKEFKVGLFVAAGLALLYLGFNYLKGIDFFSSTNKYYAVYENVDQLAVSNPILVNGFAVGRVSNIKILQNQQNKILVELDIDADVKLGDSTKAILNSDFLGGKSILLSIGKITKVLQPNDTVLTEVAKGMFDVISETATPVADNVQTTLRKFNLIIDNLTRNSQQLDAIFEKLLVTPDLINQTLKTTNGKIEVVSGNFNEVALKLNETLSELKPTLQNFKTISDSLKEIQINETILKTQATLDNLNKTLSKLNTGDNTASKLMTEDSLYNNLNNLLLRLDTLVTHFDNNPKHFLGPLGKSSKKIERDRRKEEEEKAKATPKNN
jgi:phospholipid/cholesterol/gamma-HCH transport system substrate-binding protein